MGKPCIFCKKIVPRCLFLAAGRLQTFYLKGPHRLLNWQIQVTRVSWVGQSTSLLIEFPIHQVYEDGGRREGGAPKEQMVPLVQSSGQHGDAAPPRLLWYNNKNRDREYSDDHLDEQNDQVCKNSDVVYYDHFLLWSLWPELSRSLAKTSVSIPWWSYSLSKNNDKDGFCPAGDDGTGLEIF